MNSALRILAIVAIASLAACTPKVKPVTGTGTPPEVTNTDPKSGSMDDSETAIWARGNAEEILQKIQCLQTRTITFDLDSTAIGGQYSEAVACHARFLKTFSNYKLTLGGHADERGTREYNLGLGERRGNGVSDALKAEGASGSQIEVVSYGEEQPTCTESAESCWANNRRAEFSYSK
jgi:peptidoglycan-associated lipoprotein